MNEETEPEIPKPVRFSDTLSMHNTDVPYVAHVHYTLPVLLAEENWRQTGVAMGGEYLFWQ